MWVKKRSPISIKALPRFRVRPGRTRNLLFHRADWASGVDLRCLELVAAVTVWKFYSMVHGRRDDLRRAHALPDLPRGGYEQVWHRLPVFFRHVHGALSNDSGHFGADCDYSRP